MFEKFHETNRSLRTKGLTNFGDEKGGIIHLKKKITNLFQKNEDRDLFLRVGCDVAKKATTIVISNHDFVQSPFNQPTYYFDEGISCCPIGNNSTKQNHLIPLLFNAC
jgi:hypothetical protein